jgi:hypothetical protein
MDAQPQSTTLQELIDYHDIRKMLAVYCHGCDRGDGPKMASVYGKDSFDNHGTYKGPGLEYPKVVMDNLYENGTKVTHLLGQSQINVNGSRASGETYFLASIVAKDESGQDIVTFLSGRYVDTMVKEGGQWKIDKRLCVRDHSITLDIKKDWLKDAPFLQGLLSGKDVSYDVLGLPPHAGLPWDGKF